MDKEIVHLIRHNLRGLVNYGNINTATSAALDAMWEAVEDVEERKCIRKLRDYIWSHEFVDTAETFDTYGGKVAINKDLGHITSVTIMDLYNNTVTLPIQTLDAIHALVYGETTVEPGRTLDEGFSAYRVARKLVHSEYRGDFARAKQVAVRLASLIVDEGAPSCLNSVEVNFLLKHKVQVFEAIRALSSIVF